MREGPVKVRMGFAGLDRPMYDSVCPCRGVFLCFETGKPFCGRGGVKGAVFGVHLDP
jgi:hypothetical protein